ncbi:PAS domain S-box protein [Nostoc sp. FACHB-152]|uniref:ATP-binding protein n=1 Tax=unclassified Nostoc TaxID=2593658 RepID=UPI001683FD03|nr:MULTISPECIES: ATP-binding protein [unclassified Nostoc]MBD2448252.1 PAS domain S-box protein [Nostoc sp. FACHB-152]MBD2469273.1 PAS domain S-box protein [Nostoc sp. FACHB-145]
MSNGNRLQLQDKRNSIVAQVAGAIAIVVGSLVLLGWLFDIEFFKRGSYASWVTMKANTALCFVLSGISLWLSQISRNKQPDLGLAAEKVAETSIYFWLARVGSIGLIVIGSLTILQYLSGWNLGIDELLFRDSPNAVLTPYTGRMGFNTAFNLILVGCALELLINPKSDRSYLYSQIFTLIAGVISLQALIGYIYDVKILYSLSAATTSMAIHTAILFIVLCVGILWASADQGLMQVVVSETYGGLLARRLLIAAIAVPLLIGWFIVQSQRARHYDPAFAISVFAIVLIVVFAFLVWQCAAIVERLCYNNERNQKALQAYEEKLRSFVDSNVIGILFGDIYGNISQANDEFLGMVDYTREDLLAGRLKWNEITPPEYLNLDEQGIAEAKANTNGACTPYKKEYLRKDGSRIPVLIGYVLVGEERQETIGFILNLSDRAAAEAEQQKLVSLIENSSDFIGLTTIEGQSFYLNRAGQQLVGLSEIDDVKQKTILDFVLPKDRTYLQKYILPSVIEQGHWQGEFTFRNFQTGQAIPVDFHIFTITDRNTNQPIALATITHNITEQKQAQEKILQLNRDLQRRVSELQTLLDVIPIGIGIAEDPECKTIKVNPCFAKQLGIPLDTNASLSAPVQEMPTAFKVYREGRELSPEELSMQYAAKHGVEVLDLEVDVVHENGQVTKLLEYVAPLFDEEGKTRGCIGAFLDITSRKQAEQLQQNQQKWLEEVLNLMPRPLLFIEPGTARVTFANRTANELAGGEFPQGIPAEEYHTAYYCTDAVGNQIPNDQMPGVRVARGERLHGFEMDWHTSQGVHSLLIFADTIPAMHGHPATCVVVFQDVSKLKQAEKALSLGNQRLQLLFGTASALLSSQQPLTLIDSLFSKLAQQIGLDIYFNYVVEDNSKVMRLASYRGFGEELAKQIERLEFGQAVCGTVAQCGLPIYLENVQQSTDPKTQLIRSLGVNAYYSYPLIAQGRLLGTLSFGSCTRSYFTENQRGMMQAVCDQIAIAIERSNLIASLQQQTEQLQETNRMKDEFLAILSHELRSPLNAILGWAQLLRGRKLSDTQIAKALETIERNARNQTQMIEDLLDISRMIRGKLRLNVCTCNLISIIESTIETVSLAAQAKGIQLQFYVDNHGVQHKQTTTAPCIFYPPPENIVQQQTHSQPQFLISGDSDRLQQIIWNLLSNAIKFTPQDGKVEIRLSQSIDDNQEFRSNKTGYAQIQVIDTGIGIKQEFLPYVFDRFRQADSSSTRAHGGLGLGLAIVRHLVELHGGTVQADSLEEGQGTTFTVKLPLILPSQENTPTAFRHTNVDFSEMPVCPSLAGVRVLVVDDEADTRDYISTVLQQCQAEVQTVSSAQEALQMICQWKPDVLVSDIGMPQEDGYSLIRKLRSQPPEQGGKIPAAALTAYARAEDRMRAIQEGFQLHLPKPIQPAELATVVASLVGRT